MTTGLHDRVAKASDLLLAIETRLAAAGRSVPAHVEERLAAYARGRTQLEDVRALIDVRTDTWTVLDSINGDHARVPMGGNEVGLGSARTILTQGYLATTWSIADTLTWVSGRIVCNEGVTRNPQSGPKLYEHFARDTKASPSSGIVHDLYAFPIALSYAIRNLLIHDGGRTDGRGFFEAAGGRGAFAVSTDGWSAIEKKVREEYKVDASRCRAPEPWPWPREDLREVLRICEREIDDALGILLVSACAGLHAQVEMLR